MSASDVGYMFPTKRDYSSLRHLELWLLQRNWAEVYPHFSHLVGQVESFTLNAGYLPDTVLHNASQLAKLREFLLFFERKEGPKNEARSDDAIRLLLSEIFAEEVINLESIRIRAITKDNIGHLKNYVDMDSSHFWPEFFKGKLDGSAHVEFSLSDRK